MQKKSTIKDVAQKAGVAVGTVSRIINGHPSVDPATRKHVLRIIAKIGYKPNAVAQSMRTQTTHTIGFVVPDISNPLWARILRAASAVCMEKKYSVVVVSTGGVPGAEIDALAAMAHRRMDGLMLTLNSPKETILPYLKQINSPLVMMEREFGEEFDTVLTDHGGGAYAAARYLIELGHQRIAMITAATGIRPGSERVNGYKRALADAKLDIDNDLLRCGSFDAEFALSEAPILLNRRNPPTAIIAGGNQLLPGILQAATLNDVSIPGQLSVICCGDTDLAQLSSPATSVIRANSAAIGTTAAQLLLKRLISGTNAEPSRIIFPSELVVRGSCSAPAKKPPLQAWKPENGLG
jgi:LacI family transcriptional regulator